MGTTINLGELMREWRTVVMSCFAMVVAVISVFAVIPLIGKEAAIVSIPVVNGGIIATQIMVEAAAEKGLVLAAALGTIVYAIQKFVGTPPASYFGIKEAELVLADFRKKKAEGLVVGVHENRMKASRRRRRFTKRMAWINISLILPAWVLRRFLPGFLTGLQSKRPLIIRYGSCSWGRLSGSSTWSPLRYWTRAEQSGCSIWLFFAGIIPSLGKINVADLSTLAWQTTVVFCRGSYRYAYFYVLAADVEIYRFQKPFGGYCHGPAAWVPCDIPDCQ
jgi:hypothetical protein